MSDPHPHYPGGCDAFGPDGACSECLNVISALTAERDALRTEIAAVTAARDALRARLAVCEAAIEEVMYEILHWHREQALGDERNGWKRCWQNLDAALADGGEP